MTVLTDALSLPIYTCIADRSDMGAARGTIAAEHGDLTAYLSDAADELAECHKEGLEARVFRVEFMAGKLVDVTDRAQDVIDSRRHERRQE